MLVYILLLVVVFSCPVMLNSLELSKAKQNLYALNLIFVCIFLLCVLKSPEVGRDIKAYKSVYEMTQNVALNDFSFIYFEPGYILLMKICILLRMPFQAFMVVVYLLITFPIYIFIKKCSDDYWLSSLIYICYMFLEFNFTGIRQAIASSIILMAFIFLLEKKKYFLIKYFLLVTIASSFHSAALIAYFAILALMINSLLIYTLILIFSSGAILFLRQTLLLFIKEWATKESMNASASLHIGGNFLFIVVLAIFFVTSVRARQRAMGRHKFVKDNFYYILEEKRVERDSLFSRIYMMSIYFLLLFGSDTSVRSSMLLSQVMLISLPNCLGIFRGRSRVFVYFFWIVFLTVFFVTNSLIPNNFDIVPYQFFWEN